jgi:hypothetical protein
LTEAVCLVVEVNVARLVHRACSCQGIVVQHKLNIASPGSNAPVATGKSTAACKSQMFTLDTVLLPADIQLPDEVGRV